MMHARASDAPVEGVSSARGSVQTPAWWVSATADVMFNIDNSHERNGLWSFRKILCVFFFFFLNCHFLALRLDSCHPSAGFDGQISTKLLSPPMKWTLWKQSRVELSMRGEMCFIGKKWFLISLLKRLMFSFLFYLFAGLKKCHKPWRKMPSKK